MLKKNANYALFFNEYKSVYTFFMRFNLDVIYLDRGNKVVGIIKSLKPFRIAFPMGNATSILEVSLDAPDAEMLSVGKKLIDF